MNIKKIGEAIKEGNFEWKKHALERMFERNISREVVKNTIFNGEIIEYYPDDNPFPRMLILGWNTKDIPDKCPLCGGAKKEGKTTFTVDLGFGIVVVRDVPARVCDQCGADWINDSVASRLEEIVQDAKEKHHMVEVTSLGVS